LSELISNLEIKFDLVGDHSFLVYGFINVEDFNQFLQLALFEFQVLGKVLVNELSSSSRVD
jgi:hypothetical protein